eukprot:Awhi_evm1s10811
MEGLYVPDRSVEYDVNMTNINSFGGSYNGCLQSPVKSMKVISALSTHMYNVSASNFKEATIQSAKSILSCCASENQSDCIKVSINEEQPLLLFGR